MALFGNQEKRAAKEQAKLDKQMEKDYKILAKYGIESLNNHKDAESAKRISTELAGSGLMEVGMKLTKPEAAVPISLQRAIMEQNFIIIRQLDELITLLKNGQD